MVIILQDCYINFQISIKFCLHFVHICAIIMVREFLPEHIKPKSKPKRKILRKGDPGMIIFWIIFFIAALMAEAATFALVSVWFAAGALGALITASLGGNITLQLIVFTLISGILLAFTRPLLKKLFPGKFIPTNSELEVGKTAVVTEAIDNETGKGRVRLGGVNWAAVSADGTKIPEEAVVTVTEVRSAKLAVILKDADEAGTRE